MEDKKYIVHRRGFFRHLYLHKDGGGRWTPRIEDAYLFDDVMTANMVTNISPHQCWYIKAQPHLVAGRAVLQEGK